MSLADSDSNVVLLKEDDGVVVLWGEWEEKEEEMQ
jgi:hypothetical protein